MELEGVFERPLWRKNISKSKPFLINTTQWFDTDKKLMVRKIFSAVCQVIFDFDNLTIPYLVIWNIFWQTEAYCVVNVPCHTKFKFAEVLIKSINFLKIIQLQWQ